LVKRGEVSPGNVMAVFWVCLIATSNLQMCIPQFITLAKGKFAMASLIALIESSSSSNPSSSDSSSILIHHHRRPTYLKKITPIKCSGELALHGIIFSYPTRPTLPVLQDVSLFLNDIHGRWLRLGQIHHRTAAFAGVRPYVGDGPVRRSGYELFGWGVCGETCASPGSVPQESSQSSLSGRSNDFRSQHCTTIWPILLHAWLNHKLKFRHLKLCSASSNRGSSSTKDAFSYWAMGTTQ
jgi:hypothetical protein